MNPSLRDLLAKSGFERPDLLWISDTVLHAVAGEVGAKAVAVRIADDNTKFAHAPAAVRWAEEKLCRRADVIFASSFPLEERLSARYGMKVRLLRNGVDYDFFQGDFPRPSEYKDIKGPIAVYVGAIEEWFSVEWVETLAQARRDLTIVLVGRAGIDLSRLARLPNVRFLGPRPYDLLPAVLAHADCGIIPFRRTPLVESVSPLKLFEFLASGLPVVSTKWKELEHLQSPALLAEDSREFVQSVGRVIDEDWKTERGALFRDFAKANSWQARYKLALGALAPFLG
jgi:glycosyltransferase involved in cell wall biosynthesis